MLGKNCQTFYYTILDCKKNSKYANKFFFFLNQTQMFVEIVDYNDVMIKALKSPLNYFNDCVQETKKESLFYFLKTRNKRFLQKR